MLCLNPCSNGILKYKQADGNFEMQASLNPCSNGILKYSLDKVISEVAVVLILVLMEY